MSNQNQEPENSTLKELFNRNTNLLTILGIFNALAIFANQQNSNYNILLTLLSLCFMGLSLIILGLVIIDLYNNISSLMCLMVVFILGFAEIMLFVYTISIYHTQILKGFKFFLAAIIGLTIMAIVKKFNYSKITKSEGNRKTFFIIGLIVIAILQVITYIFDIQLTDFFNNIDSNFKPLK